MNRQMFGKEGQAAALAKEEMAIVRRGVRDGGALAGPGGAHWEGEEGFTKEVCI